MEYLPLALKSSAIISSPASGARTVRDSGSFFNSSNKLLERSSALFRLVKIGGIFISADSAGARVGSVWPMDKIWSFSTMPLIGEKAETSLHVKVVLYNGNYSF